MKTCKQKAGLRLVSPSQPKKDRRDPPPSIWANLPALSELAEDNGKLEDSGVASHGDQHHEGGEDEDERWTTQEPRREENANLNSLSFLLISSQEDQLPRSPLPSKNSVLLISLEDPTPFLVHIKG